MPTTSLRLPQQLVDEVDRIASGRNLTRSQVIRDALEAYCTAEQQSGGQDRLKLLDELLVYAGSGKGDLARNSETYLRELIGEKRRKRSR